jgi:limonene-1,2-epoxide hydrolase
MSQEKVEIVRRFLVTMVRGDYDATVRDFDADAKWHNTSAFPGPTICSGPAEIAAFGEYGQALEAAGLSE